MYTTLNLYRIQGKYKIIKVVYITFLVPCQHDDGLREPKRVAIKLVRHTKNSCEWLLPSFSKYPNRKERGALYFGLYGQWKWNGIEVPCPQSENSSDSFGNSHYRFV
jgi:hypothetical protein